ncbi:erythromycin esterase family protein [Edaphobacter modestus]|uniref:erythromycin esterase family protein n=1 Tax=Edaphobacter modestus TaxID=388466 RepID=UPI003BF87073
MHNGGVIQALNKPRFERAIGVIYRPETARLSRCFHGRLTGQFDAFIHIDRAMALIPFEPTGAREASEVPWRQRRTIERRSESKGVWKLVVHPYPEKTSPSCGLLSQIVSLTHVLASSDHPRLAGRSIENQRCF